MHVLSFCHQVNTETFEELRLPAEQVAKVQAHQPPIRNRMPDACWIVGNACTCMGLQASLLCRVDLLSLWRMRARRKQPEKQFTPRSLRQRELGFEGMGLHG